MKIEDNQSVIKVLDRNGNEVPFYDDGFGPLWLYSSSCGNFTYAAAAVRAQNESDAWEIVQDEFLPECDLTIDEIVKEYGFSRKLIRIMKDKDGREYIPDSLPLDPESELVRWEYISRSDPEAWPENHLFQEAYTFRPNGPNNRDIYRHGIACLDLNGDNLRRACEADELKIELLTEEE